MPKLDISSILQLPQLSTDQAPQNGEVFATTVLNHLNMASPLILCLSTFCSNKKEGAQLETKAWFRHNLGVTVQSVPGHSKKVGHTIFWFPTTYMAPHSSTLAWKIPWTEEPGELQSMGSHRVGHD